ncbi:hypothetical protein K3152_06885 [Qipengyuania sp. 1NDH17]|uniref:Uncharacterized protein n=1 Tax=Qipengyuania polymorpha TaxID=2867234 RepID=A0ABS7IWQ5_9SPHN|nr:hypothetical protein [Qipengyuania polymorpha]MBX7457967.1 hypothetical protein [Qipengyuania polymorpha]
MSLLALSLALAGGGEKSTRSDDAIDGLWSGTLGRTAITACFANGRGSYYYDKYLIPIPLRDGKDGARWTEGHMTGGPAWSLARTGDDRATGEWSDGKRSLPIRLEQREWTASEEGWEDACSSREFFAPRLFEPVFVTEPAQLGGWTYEKVIWQPPAHFDDNQFDGFRFDADKPGDAAIGIELGKQRPTGRSDDLYIQCSMDSVSSFGNDGSVSITAEPIFANARWLSVEDTQAYFCAGAHPAYSWSYRVFDRASGVEITPQEAWLNRAAFTPGEYGGFELQDVLRDLLQREYDPEQDDECREAIGWGGSWTISLVAEGLRFIPSMPHAMFACTAPIALSWSDLEPYLSEEGERVRDFVEN